MGKPLLKNYVHKYMKMMISHKGGHEGQVNSILNLTDNSKRPPKSTLVWCSKIQKELRACSVVRDFRKVISQCNCFV